MNRLRRGIGLLLSLAILATPLLLWWQYQAIADWWKLRDYQPPAAISALAAADTMTDSARHIFYVNHPQLLGQIESFRQSCPKSEETIVLGCYHSGQRGIALYDVKDQRLQGVEEVTAAHEMLHAAYERLSGDERKRIDSLLTNYYQNSLTDKRIQDTIESYKKSDPSQIVNEMHSIFGTEIAALPPELENYYKRYFVDRGAVVKFASGYEGEFSSRLNQIKDIERRLDSLKQQIDAQEQELDTLRGSLDADRDRLDSLRNSGQISEYNAQVSAFNTKIRSYNAKVSELKSDITLYNELVEQHNSIAGELRSLEGAIDTRQTAQPVR